MGILRVHTDAIGCIGLKIFDVHGYHDILQFIFSPTSIVLGYYYRTLIPQLLRSYRTIAIPLLSPAVGRLV